MNASQAAALFLSRIKSLEKDYRERLFELGSLVSKVEAQKGDQGAPGERGERGEKGERGERGPTGKTGAKGEKGDKGEKGERGDTGPQGLPGQAGEQGLRGPEGPAGPVGPVGRDGKNGKDGRPGRIPQHKIQNGAIAFETRPGEYGSWIRFTQTNQYFGGGGGSDSSSEATELSIFGRDSVARITEVFDRAGVSLVSGSSLFDVTARSGQVTLAAPGTFFVVSGRTQDYTIGF